MCVHNMMLQINEWWDFQVIYNCNCIVAKPFTPSLSKPKISWKLIIISCPNVPFVLAMMTCIFISPQVHLNPTLHIILCELLFNTQ